MKKLTYIKDGITEGKASAVWSEIKDVAQNFTKEDLNLLVIDGMRTASLSSLDSRLKDFMVIHTDGRDSESVLHFLKQLQPGDEKKILVVVPTKAVTTWQLDLKGIDIAVAPENTAAATVEFMLEKLGHNPVRPEGRRIILNPIIPQVA